MSKKDISSIPLPTKADFFDTPYLDSPFSCSDELHAAKIFLGKTAEEAEALFRGNFLFYQEELSYLGRRAFRYYLVSALNYVQSSSSDDDSDAASTLCQVLKSRLGCVASDPDLPALAVETVRAILSDFGRFECPIEIYGDVPASYRDLLEQLEESMAKRRA